MVQLPSVACVKFISSHDVLAILCELSSVANELKAVRLDCALSTLYGMLSRAA